MMAKTSFYGAFLWITCLKYKMASFSVASVKGLVLSTYFDAGTVKWEKSRSGSATLKGWGIGLTYAKPDDWFARFDYARRIGFEENLSNDARSKQRMWFLVGKIF